MEGGISRADIWDSAGKAGLVLGAVSSAYLALSHFMTGTSSTAMAVVMSLLDILLWALKFAGCIILMKLFMTRFAASHEGATNSDTFKFGMATALLSALIYAGFYLAYATILAPDVFAEAIDAVKEGYSSMMTQEALDSIDSMNLGSISFFSNLIYCFIYGTVLSSILSRNIPSRNPFDGQ